MEWHAFISHASEDKEAVARPLAQRLKVLGFDVWYDEFSLTIGDSLRRSIDRGLANSEFGIVILSKVFLQKEWPQRELDGLVAIETSGRRKIVLPVWHKIDASEVRSYSPILADRLGVSTSKGLDHVVKCIVEAFKQHWTLAKVVGPRLSTEAQSADSPVTLTRRSNAYCSRCGAVPGDRNVCVGAVSSHSFVTGNISNVYCSRCGVVPGARNLCVGAVSSHSFIIGG